MQTIDVPVLKNMDTNQLNAKIREEIIMFSKDFKRAWISLGRHLYAVWQDKLFRSWGFDDFEDYIEREVGLKKTLAKKLLKSYLFLEEDEPNYLEIHYGDDKGAEKVPGYEEINLLRLARQNKDLTKGDYAKIKRDIFDKGKNASVVRKDLTALMKERKYVDPDEEREARNRAAINRLINSIRSFQKDMVSLKLIPSNIIEEAKELLVNLEEQLN